MSQRDNCSTCLAPILRVWINGKPVVLDWPRHEHGDVAVEHALNGTWFARNLPVGAPLMAVEQRFRRHDCGEPVPSISEPVHAPADDLRAAQRGDWQKALSARARDQRNRRGRRPEKPVTGVRVRPQ